MRVARIGIDRYSVLGLIGRDLAVTIVLLKIHPGVIFDRYFFTLSHGWEGIFKPGAGRSPRGRRGIASDHDARVNDESIAEDGVFDIHIGNVPGRSYGNGVMECTGFLVVSSGLLHVGLSRFRFIENDVTFNIVRELDSFLTVIKLGTIGESEADIGGLFQSRIVWIVLVERDAQPTICGKDKIGIHLVSFALIYDIDLQWAGLLMNDLDAVRHLIGQGPIVVKLITRTLCKRKNDRIVFALFYYILPVFILSRADNYGICQEIGKIGTLLYVCDLNPDHRSVFHGDVQRFLAAERGKRIEHPSIMSALLDLQKVFVAEPHICNIADEFIRFIRRSDAEDDRELLQGDRAGAFQMIGILFSCLRIFILEVHCICQA